MMHYFISDLHLGDHRILRRRLQFSDLSVMDNTLIDNWNNRIGNDDIVYILGDMICAAEPIQYLNRLSGKKLLLVGNHDEAWLDNISDEQKKYYFSEGIYDFHRITKDTFGLVMCHYPIQNWDSSKRVSIHVCGHIHERTDLEYELFRSLPMAFNAGVDITGYKPLTLPELIECNESFYRRCYNQEQRSRLQLLCKLFS